MLFGVARTQPAYALDKTGLEDLVRNYYACVKDRTLAYAKTKETPADIAEAAMGSCRHWRADAIELANLSDSYRLRFEETLDSNARQGSIGQTLAARHPETSKAGAPPARPIPSRASASAIRQAYTRWKDLQRAGGIQGVREESQRCFQHAQHTLSWIDIDQCIAIDKFALVLDRGLHTTAGTPIEPYFSDDVVITRWNDLVGQLPGDRDANIARVTDVSDRSEKLLLAEGPL